MALWLCVPGSLRVCPDRQVAPATHCVRTHMPRPVVLAGAPCSREGGPSWRRSI
jgi:hypothetical protein